MTHSTHQLLRLFYNSAITKPVVCVRIVVEMGSHLTKMVPVLITEVFSQLKVLKSHCVISQEPFLYSMRTLSSFSEEKSVSVRSCVLCVCTPACMHNIGMV